MTMSFSEASNPWRKIYDRIGKAAALEQLAEECDELGHAALKLARIVRGENPARMTYDEAFAKMIRETADVLNALDVLDEGFSRGIYEAAVPHKPDKMKRWYDSLFKIVAHT